MAAAAFEYKNKFKELGVHVFSSNYALYGDMSNRVYRILKNYTPEVEVYSIDECFLHFNNFSTQPLDECGKQIRREILQKTLLPTCIGIAPKGISKSCKSYRKEIPAVRRCLFDRYR